MTNVNAITRLKALLIGIEEDFYIEDWDGDSEDGPIIRKVCVLDRQQEENLLKIKAELKSLISDLAESEDNI